MQKFPIINDKISKNDRDLYNDMKIISEFVIKYRAFLDIDSKIIQEVYQIINSINIILSWVLKASSKKKDIDNQNKKAKNEEDRCLINLECAKVEIIKDKILNFNKIEAKKIIWCTDWTIRDIETHSPRILKLIEELQTSFVSAINWENKVEKIKKVEETTQVNIQVQETNSESITIDDWKNPKIPEQKENTITWNTDSETINIKDWQNTEAEKEEIEEQSNLEDPNIFYRNFNSKNLVEIKDFYQLCKENQKTNYFLKFLKSHFQSISIKTKLELIDFLIFIDFDPKYIKEKLLNSTTRSQINSRNLEQREFYTDLSRKLNKKLNPNIVVKPRDTSVYSKITEQSPKKEEVKKLIHEKTKDWWIKLSRQWNNNEVKVEEKVEDIIIPKEEVVNPIIEEKILSSEPIIVIDSEVTEEENTIIPQTENIILTETREEKKWIKIVKKRIEKKTLVKIDELINFIQNIWDNAKINNSFISENIFEFEDWEKTIIFRQVEYKLNILIDELDYKKLYFLLELCEKIELNLDLVWLKSKFLKLALDLTKTEKNNNTFKLFLDKYIINN